MKKIKIAIDGYSGTGKSSTAREVARELEYTFIDTGAMYRAVTWYALEQNLDIENLTHMIPKIRELKLKFPDSSDSGIYLNEQLLTTQIRKPQVDELVSKVAAIAHVRHEMVRQQQNMGKEGGIVMEGRDIGTEVFPDAQLKIFMTASDEARAKRRQMELKEKGIDSDLNWILQNLQERDKIDTTRSQGPLKKAEGVVEINTTSLTFDEQVKIIVRKAKKIIYDY